METWTYDVDRVGEDGKGQVVTVRTTDGSITRTVVKLAILPIET